MKKSLVGFTGFVGGNLAAATAFDGLYNSKNIGDAFGTAPDLLVFAGVRAEKFLANTAPEKDYAAMKEAAWNIGRIAPRQVALISTVDVFAAPDGADEGAVPDAAGAYGKNRLALEEMVRALGVPVTVFRLPALYGPGLKKNFLYDLIHLIPGQLSPALAEDLARRDPALLAPYTPGENGFYKCGPLAKGEAAALRARFTAAGFTALQFTDSRASYQFYPLTALWGHMEKALAAGLPLVHLATAPVTAAEVYARVRGGVFENHMAKTPARYDLRTRYNGIFGGEEGYIFNKEYILDDIVRFVAEQEALL